MTRNFSRKATSDELIAPEVTRPVPWDRRHSLRIKLRRKNREGQRLRFFTRRSELILNLLDRVEEESDREFAHMEPGTETTRKKLSLRAYRSSEAVAKLSRYKRSTLIAMHRALPNPQYRVLAVTSPAIILSEQEVREAAVYFDVLLTAGTDYRVHSMVLRALHASGFKSDITALKGKRRTHAESVLRLIIHFHKANRLTDAGCPKPIVDLLGRDPGLLDRLIRFADSRQCFLPELNAGLFQSILLLEAPALSDGVL